MSILFTESSNLMENVVFYIFDLLNLANKNEIDKNSDNYPSTLLQKWGVVVVDHH